MYHLEVEKNEYMLVTLTLFSRSKDTKNVENDLLAQYLLKESMNVTKLAKI